MIRPWLWLPAEWSHDIAPYALSMYAELFPEKNPEYRARKWRGLFFRNPVGIAGGVDKTGSMVSSFWKIGAGFVEVGTVTPRAQQANPGKIIDRDISRTAVWNKMGFPNEGAQELALNIRNLTEHETPVFVNIGKNRDTKNEDAVEDYLQCIRIVEKYASEKTDAYVINISSPNTKGLRELQSQNALDSLLGPVSASTSKPYLVKLSPDLNDDDLKHALDVSLKNKAAGFILTNTTLSREPGMHFSNEGGVSGAPLAERSRRALTLCLNHLGKNREDLLIVSAGGVLNSKDVDERLQMGADLVQIYSTLVFNGPRIFKDLRRQLGGIGCQKQRPNHQEQN